MVDINPTMSKIILNVNGLKTCTDCQSGLRHTVPHVYVICKEYPLNIKTYTDYK